MLDKTAVSGSLPSKDLEATFLLEAFIQSWFTHATTRYLHNRFLKRDLYGFPKPSRPLEAPRQTAPVLYGPSLPECS